MLKGCSVIGVQLKSASATPVELFSTLQMVAVTIPQKPKLGRNWAFLSSLSPVVSLQILE